MTRDEIKDYRKILEKEYMDKDIEIDSVLSYVTIGALGFFITINDKFIKFQVAQCKVILIISLILLFISFALILLRKIRTNHHDTKMMFFVDQMQPDKQEQDDELFNLWTKTNSELTMIRNGAIYSLGLGVILQIIFLLLNLK